MKPLNDLYDFQDLRSVPRLSLAASSQPFKMYVGWHLIAVCLQSLRRYKALNVIPLPDFPSKC